MRGGGGGGAPLEKGYPTPPLKNKNTLKKNPPR